MNECGWNKSFSSAIRVRNRKNNTDHGRGRVGRVDSRTRAGTSQRGSGMRSISVCDQDTDPSTNHSQQVATGAGASEAVRDVHECIGKARLRRLQHWSPSSPASLHPRSSAYAYASGSPARPSRTRHTPYLRNAQAPEQELPKKLLPIFSKQQPRRPHGCQPRPQDWVRCPGQPFHPCCAGG